MSRSFCCPCSSAPSSTRSLPAASRRRRRSVACRTAGARRPASPRPAAPPPAGDVQEQPRRGQRHQQARASVGDEWQRHAGQRRQPEDREEVDRRLGHDQRGQPGRRAASRSGRGPAARSGSPRSRTARTAPISTRDPGEARAPRRSRRRSCRCGPRAGRRPSARSRRARRRRARPSRARSVAWVAWKPAPAGIAPRVEEARQPRHPVGLDQRSPARRPRRGSGASGASVRGLDPGRDQQAADARSRRPSRCRGRARRRSASRQSADHGSRKGIRPPSVRSAAAAWRAGGRRRGPARPWRSPRAGSGSSPAPSQRLAPLTVCPTPGHQHQRPAARSTTTEQQRGQRARDHRARRGREAIRIASSPSAPKITVRLR